MAELQLEELVNLALDEARALGVDQAEVSASQDTGLSVTARLGDVENLEYTNDRGIGITVYRDQRKGNASTSETTPQAIRETVAKAASIASLTAQDRYAGLADASLMCEEVPEIGLEYPWEIDAATAIDIAVTCEKHALDFDKRISNSEGATVSSNRGVRAYGNTHGFIGSFARTSHSVSCVVLAEADGDMQRDYYYSSARDAADLDDVEEIGKKAARRTVDRLGARKIDTTRAPVLFIPELARGFIGHAMGALTGAAQYRKASFLLGAAGEQLFPEFVNVLERPHIDKGVSSAPYDAEGVATYDRDIVTGGTLQGYFLSSYSARRLGLESTANAGGMQNLVVPGNAGDRDELVAQMGTGLLVEELIGQGVNGVTGDYSRGAVGHWVEDGEIAFPVHEVTIAGNLRELYPRIVAIGSDQDIRGGIRCGSLLVEGMTIAGS
ncbi:MAG: metalloprotease PmbA [Woeseiaceae bacterium]|nr:metalloprotease PmbA [Woeseiaceae bacterium]